LPAYSIQIPVNVPTGGERGDIPDHQLDANYFRELQNMYVNSQGRLILRDGYLPLASSGPGGAIIGLIYFRTSGGSDRTVAANRTGLWSYEASAWVDKTGTTVLTATNSDLARFQVFSTSGNYNVIHVNGKNANQIWDGAASTFSDMGGSPPVAMDVAAAANRVLLLISPDNVRISDFNDPNTYPATLTVRLVDRGDRMLGITRMGRLAAAIYGEDSQWIARAQIGSFPFRFELVDEKPGPISKAAVVPDGKIHYYLGVDGVVYRNDGVNVVPYHRGMQDYVTTNLNFTNREVTHGVLIRRIRHIFWFFPTGVATDPNGGVYLDLDRRAMGRIAIGSITASAQWTIAASTTWDSLSALTWDNIAGTHSTWDSMGGAAEPREVLGDASGQVHSFGAGTGSDDGTAIVGIWELPLRPWAGPGKNFIPLEFESWFRQQSGATTIEPGARVSDTLMTEPSVTAFTNFDIQTDQRNSINLASATGAAGNRFVSIRHRVSTTTGGGTVSWLGGILGGESSEAAGGPT